MLQSQPSYSPDPVSISSIGNTGNCVVVSNVGCSPVEVVSKVGCPPDSLAFVVGFIVDDVVSALKNDAASASEVDPVDSSVEYAVVDADDVVVSNHRAPILSNFITMSPRQHSEKLNI